MNHSRLCTLTGTMAAILVAASIGLAGQSEFTNNVKHNSGQDVQPVFEGWARVDDGTYDLYFGYLNRNWVEQMQVPIGSANNIQPGGPDRGQPTYFYARTNRKAFTVNVPADFGKKEVVWTLTVNGKTRTAYGHLRPDWEITPDGGASGTKTTQEARGNKPPVLALSAAAPAQVGKTASLVAAVSDDGLPVPRGRMKAAVGQETPPGLSSGRKDVPVNLPWLREEERSGGRGAPADGLTVRWVVFRGPAAATFSPATAKPTDGKATTSATFTVPGEYVLRAAAHDGLLTTYRDVVISVAK